MTHGTVRGMVKTTVYLPESLKEALERASAREGRSEAELIREALERRVGGAPRPRPRLPLIDLALGDPAAADRVEALLDRFGER